MSASRHLLGLDGLTASQLTPFLDRARSLKLSFERHGRLEPLLSGTVVVNLFFENSTRTRMSFELAARQLGATVLNFATSASSTSKGETLVDTARNLEAMGTRIFILRHHISGAAHHLSRQVQGSVVNAGDGIHEHPTQALLDLFTLRERFGRLEGLKVAIVGDILHSRVARSNLFGLKALGAEVRLAGPPTLLPKAFETLGARVFESMDEALEGVDVVMMLRIQLERMEGGYFPSLQEFTSRYGLNSRRLALAAPHAVVLHPGPVNWGVELSPELEDGRLAILDQVANGVWVRAAVLATLSGEGA